MTGGKGALNALLLLFLFTQVLKDTDSIMLSKSMEATLKYEAWISPLLRGGLVF